MSAPTARRGPPLVLAILLAAGSALLFLHLGRDSVWTDEAMTILPVLEARGAADLVQRVRVADTQPPASHLLLYALRGLLPRGETGWRLPSLAAVEAGLVFLFFAARRVFSRTTAAIAVAAAQFSPFLAAYAMEARNYGLWFLLIAASYWALAGWVAAAAGGERCRGSLWAYALLLALANALGLFTHLFHLFAIVTQAALVAGLLWARGTAPGRGRAVLSLLASFALSGLLFLPWALLLLRSDGLQRSVGWTRDPPLASLAYYPFAMLFGFSLGPDLRELHTQPLRPLLLDHTAALACAGAALVVVGAAWMLLGAGDGRGREERRVSRVLFFFAPLVGAAGPLLYVLLRHFPLLPRHLMYLWPFLPAGLALAWERRPRLRWPLAAVALLALVSFAQLLRGGPYAKDDERGAVHFAEERSGPAACILGEVAPVYATRARGYLKGRTDPADAIGATLTDVWLVDNRPWEDPEGRYRRKVAAAAERSGLRFEGRYEQFHGLVLLHWRRAGTEG